MFVANVMEIHTIPHLCFAWDQCGGLKEQLTDGATLTYHKHGYIKTRLFKVRLWYVDLYVVGILKHVISCYVLLCNNPAVFY